eukprot:CAMPEP_0174744354 /NCGR_PEP_ID=MMETSP1094-20130205/84080_1 /TAXON_ID=156173 /ORGANISM="Chrysochromulina brevifilum, Strain UTEX LB 985" /LENGTH=115 /DNA_ID=CAMNT_0015948729 /DNA_START=81 /DNA_END=428 /DNA_ORIENTATION=+
MTASILFSKSATLLMEQQTASAIAGQRVDRRGPSAACWRPTAPIVLVGPGHQNGTTIGRPNLKWASHDATAKVSRCSPHVSDVVVATVSFCGISWHQQHVVIAQLWMIGTEPPDE